MEYTGINCGDGFLQPLAYEKKENGKYQFVTFPSMKEGGENGVAVPFLDGEEFDEISVFPLIAQNVTYVTVKKGEEKRMYCYMELDFAKKHKFWLKADPGLFGREFRQIYP